MHTHGKFFKAFLVLYLLFLIYHATELQLESWLAIIGLCIGIALAIVAHMRHGYGTIILLLLHMAIEWSEYAQHGMQYSRKETLLYALHVLLDFAFLWQEAKVHLTKYRYLVMIGVIMGIVIIVVCMYSSHPHQLPQHGSVLVETMVIGGILGCTLSHLFARKKKCVHQSLQQ